MLKWRYFKYIPQQSNLLTMVTLMTSCMACRSILSQGWKSWYVCASRLKDLQSMMLSTALEGALLDELIVTGFDTATMNIQLNSFSSLIFMKADIASFVLKAFTTFMHWDWKQKRNKKSNTTSFLIVKY